MNTELIPTPHEPVLAKIRNAGELSTSEWYEVVFHDGEQWQSFAGSDTFDDGEVVLMWVYAANCFPDGAGNV